MAQSFFPGNLAQSMNALTPQYIAVSKFVCQHGASLCWDPGKNVAVKVNTCRGGLVTETLYTLTILKVQ